MQDLIKAIVIITIIVGYIGATIHIYQRIPAPKGSKLLMAIHLMTCLAWPVIVLTQIAKELKGESAR